ncbi:MAG: hypothetical protein ACRC9K_24130 [Afipia sp.]
MTVQYPERTIIVGAGASVPYQLPLAYDLLKQAMDRINRLTRRAQQGRQSSVLVLSPSMTRDSNEMDRALVRVMAATGGIEKVASTFKEHLVAQNLDDFVRDHPSLTDTVSMLIVICLFQKLYADDANWFKLRAKFMRGGIPVDKDWMRALVGIIRPITSPEKKLAVISFNYDGLLERSMRMYWQGSEIKYPPLNECVEFIYPHGKIAALPDQVTAPAEYLMEQSKNIRLGDQKDEVARARAKEVLAETSRVYIVGFSFSQNNLDLLGLTYSRLRNRCFIQNFQNLDKRLSRILDEAQVHNRSRDDGGMDSLIRHGFFEQ